jgi:hypothetical protein
MGTFKIELGPGQHEVSAIFKPTRSTIVFSRTRPGELASGYQVHHTRPGQFGRFDEAAVVGAAREFGVGASRKNGAEIGTGSKIFADVRLPGVMDGIDLAWAGNVDHPAGDPMQIVVVPPQG